jgi:hypothetical protein
VGCHVLSAISVWGFRAGLAITQDGTRAYLTNIPSDSVSVIDTAKSLRLDSTTRRPSIDTPERRSASLPNRCSPLPEYSRGAHVGKLETRGVESLSPKSCNRIRERKAQGRWRTSFEPVVREYRRSTRVRLKVVIEARGITEPLACDGETHVVNLHGALISTAVPLRVGMEIEIHVILTNKRAAAKVVYVDPDQPRHCGIGLDEPQNIWGISLPPEDWCEGDS